MTRTFRSPETTWSRAYAEWLALAEQHALEEKRTWSTTNATKMESAYLALAGMTPTKDTSGDKNENL
jgi:hypothetical protein